MKGHLAVIVVLGFLVCSSAGINILSFNIQQFGLTKYAKQNVVDVLINVSRPGADIA